MRKQMEKWIGVLYRDYQVLFHEKHGYRWEWSTILPCKVTYENVYFVTKDLFWHFWFICQDNWYFTPRAYHSYINAKEALITFQRHEILFCLCWDLIHQIIFVYKLKYLINSLKSYVLPKAAERREMYFPMEQIPCRLSVPKSSALTLVHINNPESTL